MRSVVLSAGLLVHRRGADGAVEVLVVHPGGPFWARRDLGAWSVPKGEHTDDEDAYEAARREFLEELGTAPPDGPAIFLGEVVQPSRKRVSVWALEGDVDTSSTHSNEITIEWPRGSGRSITFPEVDRAEWFDLDEARRRLLPGQIPFLDRLADALDDRNPAPEC